MGFNQLVFETVLPTFKRYGFEIKEERTNYVKLKSPNLTVVLSFDPRENSNSIMVGNEEHLIGIHNDTIAEVFKSSRRLRIAPSEAFLEDINSFLVTEGRDILIGNVQKIISLISYERKISQEYTTELLNKQNLRIADEAWEQQNYGDFIYYLDKLEKDKLPSAYGLKYKIAHKRLKGG